MTIKNDLNLHDVYFDTHTLLDILLLSIPEGTILEQGEYTLPKRENLTEGGGGVRTIFSLGTYAPINTFSGTSRSHDAKYFPWKKEMSTILNAHNSGKLDGEILNLSSSGIDLKAIEPLAKGDIVYPRFLSRETFKPGSKVVANNNGLLTIMSGRKEHYHYIHEVRRNFGSKMLVGDGKKRDICIENFPLPQIIVENILVNTFFGINRHCRRNIRVVAPISQLTSNDSVVSPDRTSRGFGLLSHAGYIDKVIFERDGSPVSGSVNLIEWCKQVVGNRISTGSVFFHVLERGAQNLQIEVKDEGFINRLFYNHSKAALEKSHNIGLSMGDPQTAIDWVNYQFFTQGFFAFA